MSSSELVPGDLIMVPNSGIIPCDAVLLQGESIINEAMLTGESTPFIKYALPNTKQILGEFSVENTFQSKHLLFSGTEVIQNKTHKGD